MSSLHRLFDNNRRWAAQCLAADPRHFKSKATEQAPRYLWIGCSDSRVMANEITGLDAGELFVHRNIANLVVHTDLNCLSVLQFGIEALGVRDIIICGHYGCGGIAAALRPPMGGLADNWLQHVRDIATVRAEELASLDGEKARRDRLAEMNVRWQVRNVARSAVVRQRWASSGDLQIHGVIYSLEDGLLHDLDCGFSGPDDHPGLRFD